MNKFFEKEDRSRIIAESLQYVRRYYGKTVVIKYGGHAMQDANLRAAFANDLSLLQLVDIHPVIVHGGGPQINEALSQSGIKSQFVDGLRYTDTETMHTVEKVLGATINKDIVGLINRHSNRAVGLTGKDGNLIQAQPLKKISTQTGEPLDLGWVGEVENINIDILKLLHTQKFIPVIAPIGVDKNGQSFNINADTVAAEIAIALSAEALFLLTNTGGVLDQNKQLLPQINILEAEKLILEKTIEGGMKPKVECGIHAIRNQVKSCRIIDGTIKHALLLEVFTNQGSGTFIAA